MFSIAIYLYLSLAFLLHDIEEIAKRKRRPRTNTDRIDRMYPRMHPMFVHLRDMSNQSYCIIVTDKLLLISLAVTSAIYGGFMAPLFALTWRFSMYHSVNYGNLTSTD